MQCIKLISLPVQIISYEYVIYNDSCEMHAELLIAQATSETTIELILVQEQQQATSPVAAVSSSYLL